MSASMDVLHDVSNREGWSTATDNDVLCWFIDKLVDEGRTTLTELRNFLDEQGDDGHGQTEDE